ncbi:MAG TPA: hypothetical protein VK886_09340 [Vicinamibacterales bacterium]|nr:hypothetical protein [Vicinamibacterales bacterium]
MHHDDKAGEDRDQEERPNRGSSMEPAAGSRDNTNISGNQEGRGAATADDAETPNRAGRHERGSELPRESFGEQAGGISNRPIDEEQSRQESVPPRGERRENPKED